VTDRPAPVGERTLAGQIDREAGLTGLLVLAQVNSSQAVLATLAYRLASYWAPLLAGPVAYGVFRIRYRSRASPAPQRTT
jgi:hypothetical protein